jgi:hypothetical protein
MSGFAQLRDETRFGARKTKRYRAAGIAHNLFCQFGSVIGDCQRKLIHCKF